MRLGGEREGKNEPKRIMASPVSLVCLQEFTMTLVSKLSYGLSQTEVSGRSYIVEADHA